MTPEHQTLRGKLWSSHLKGSAGRLGTEAEMNMIKPKKKKKENFLPAFLIDTFDLDDLALERCCEPQQAERGLILNSSCLSTGILIDFSLFL